MTGDTAEEVLFLIYGPAATSKRTIIEAVKATLGDYAMTADFETFIKRRYEAWASEGLGILFYGLFL
jgi:putative DNA primase/helicase